MFHIAPNLPTLRRARVPRCSAEPGDGSVCVECVSLSAAAPRRRWCWVTLMDQPLVFLKALAPAPVPLLSPPGAALLLAPTGSHILSACNSRLYLGHVYSHVPCIYSHRALLMNRTVSGAFRHETHHLQLPAEVPARATSVSKATCMCLLTPPPPLSFIAFPKCGLLDTLVRAKGQKRSRLKN